MFLLIDPYIYTQLSISDTRIVNVVAHILVENNSEIDQEKIIACIMKNHRPGMKARALQVHVERELHIN